VVIILITFTFALFGIDYYLQTHNVSNVQIEVNGYPISKQDFEVNYRRARQMRDPSQMTTALEAALKQQIIDEMIVNSVSQHAISLTRV
jgi:peptidyl-prolyl cis-trans isomerase D